MTLTRLPRSGSQLCALPSGRSLVSLSTTVPITGRELCDPLRQWDAASLNPYRIPPRPGRFTPTATLLMGRRNCGKTLAMTIYGHIMAQRYKRWAPYFRIWADYAVTYADKCHPQIVEYIAGLPPDARNLYVMLDEIQQYLRSRRSMNTNAINFTGFLTMIRKRRIEPIFSTQFPSQIDKDMLLQVDLFAEVEQIAGPKHLRLKFWDWWGQFTGRHYWKRWPPMEQDMDWSIELHHDGRFFEMYDTDQVIGSAYLSDEVQERIIREEWQGDRLRGWEPMAEEMEKAQEAVFEHGASVERPKPSWWDSLPAGQVHVRAFLQEAINEGIVPAGAKERDLAEAMSRRGWRTYRDGNRGWYAERTAPDR